MQMVMFLQAMQMVDEGRILYANPLWTRNNLRHASSNNVKMLMFESESELTRIHATFPDA